MLLLRDPGIDHLLRRATFGASPSELRAFSDLSLDEAVDRLVNYEQFPDDVDNHINQPGYVGVTTRGQFSPNTVINDARQRWLFRMVHSRRPLEEKMTLFWHNHFATAYSKVAGQTSGSVATRHMAAKPSEDPGGVTGQIELLRKYALGNFRDLLLEIAKDVAMLYWLDGRTNVKGKPQENFARELMELFTMGVQYYQEADVYAGARVFTGWNIRFVRLANDPMGTNAYYEFLYNAGQHDTDPKAFSFPIFPDGNQTIPARAASAGMQDGIDLINAVARHPETARRLARKLYGFFVSEIQPAPDSFVETIAGVYLQNNFEMKPVVRAVLLSPEFSDPSSYFARYSWPSEFVVRAIKEVGWNGFSVDSALSPLANMGQQLFEPPDVAGWDLGPTWFSTAGMLARMNFAATLTTNQRFNLRNSSRLYGQTASGLLAHFLDRFTPSDYDTAPRQDLVDYLTASGPWTGSDAQVLVKAAGLAHLIVGSSEYQFA
ncbi:MAG: DUF1800 domain-containing protein [Acidobacteria bacterium]|nr:DUF1800 domain-containing protein [Acidobacteriota bacterium]